MQAPRRAQGQPWPVLFENSIVNSARGYLPHSSSKHPHWVCCEGTLEPAECSTSAEVTAWRENKYQPRSSHCVPGASPGRGTGKPILPKRPLTLTQPGEGDYVPMTRKVPTCQLYTPTPSRKSRRSQVYRDQRSITRCAKAAASSSDQSSAAIASASRATTSTSYSESRRPQNEPP